MHKKRYCVKRRGSNRSSQSSTPAETKSGRSSSGGLAGKQGDTPTQHTNGSIQDNTAPSQQPAGILNLTLLSTGCLKGGNLSVSLIFCSSGSSAQSESMALEGRLVCSIKPFKGPKAETRELLGGTEKNSHNGPFFAK